MYEVFADVSNIALILVLCLLQALRHSFKLNLPFEQRYLDRSRTSSGVRVGQLPDDLSSFVNVRFQ